MSESSVALFDWLPVVSMGLAAGDTCGWFSESSWVLANWLISRGFSTVKIRGWITNLGFTTSGLDGYPATVAFWHEQLSKTTVAMKHVIFMFFLTKIWRCQSFIRSYIIFFSFHLTPTESQMVPFFFVIKIKNTSRWAYVFNVIVIVSHSMYIYLCSQIMYNIKKIIF
jgi:hypothetical protein